MAPADPNGFRDPVCGMRVAGDSPHRTSHGGRDYFFCSAHCLEKFKEEPEKYLAAREEEGGEPPPETKSGSAPAKVYTCPMHPEVKETKPGKCPQCGMALEPVTVEAPAPAAENQEEVQEFQDPVCGMTVGGDSPYRFSYQGQEYRFCSEHCLDEFKKKPQEYVRTEESEEPKQGLQETAPPVPRKAKAEAEKPEAEPTPEKYLICPMHPEVRVPLPRCPHCGMWLQPEETPVEEGPPTKVEEKPASAGGAYYTCPMD
ncbi:MAG TPA: YHS domain-containing protein, partial [Desulfobaccales bacterium]|nr:YHS domain-containing protein [Desulfobaccales bacterium]